MSWPKVAVGELVKISKGKKHNLAEDEAKHRYIQIDDLRNDNLLKYTDDEKGTFVEPEDVIIAWDGANAGTIGYGLKGLIGSTLARLSITSDKVNTEYFGRFLQSKFREIRDNCTGATIPHVSKVFLVSLQIPLPPLSVQKQIAAVLEKADTLRAQCQQMEQELNSLAQSVFLDMFGDPAVNPKNWKVQPVKNFLEVTTGNTPSKANDDYYSSDFIEWAKSDNINTPSDYLTKALVYLSEEGKKVARTVSAGSILVTCIAGSPSCIGNAAITDREVAFNQQINAVTPIQGKSVSEYIYMSFIVGKQLIQRASTNSMKGMVSKGNFEKIEFPLPPVELQEKYSEFFRELLDKRLLANQKFQSENELFNSLMQRAFKGELNLKDVA